MFHLLLLSFLYCTINCVLTTNQVHTPLVIAKVGSSDISTKNPAIKIRITDSSGKSVDSLSVVSDATHASTKATLFTKKQLKFDNTNKIYELNVMESKPNTGFYALKISASSTTDKKLTEGENAELIAKVTTEITVENAQLAVTDREHSMTASNAIKLPSFSKLPSKLEADVHQKMTIKFNIKDKMKNSHTKVHQAFVIFTHTDTGREIIFIAESDSNNLYSFDVDFFKVAKDFDYQSGKYSIKLVLGDAFISNPVEWILADIQLKFPHHDKPERSTVEHITYEKKPEIEHMFRPAEKRPPQMVSDSFTILVFLPLLILLIIWLRIGINFNNFQFSLSTIGFHLGLTGIFGLYLVFWLQLNMFQTLKYLAAIGCFTFLTGNRMLKAMAERRKTKTE